MMTSSQIRQSFLDFFRSRQHTIVPSSSLMPDSPNLLFTNAGMNQFVPIFLGQAPCPYKPGRAADTQKCIRAGGKHNDLEDVGLDTYHHTFFEMLGNWSFGDYFKKESIEWGWELLTKVWGFPSARLFATVYQPGPGDPSAFDQEAYDIWVRLFSAAGLDPAVHVVNGGKKDNFWMMGDTGPCGPCSEIHVDLTPGGDTKGSLVNKGTAECIEIWNHVFIQFNANADGTFSPLPARHVDTGMGFERVCGIIQCTRNFTDFTRTISNYESDVFHPIFDALSRLSGKRYGSTLPAPGTGGATEQEKIDVAFRVIADHIRTLGFAIADGINPGNTDRHYVLRRVLRRAVRYGRSLGLHEPFFYKLVDVLVESMGDTFPEIRARKQHVQDVIRIEEDAFNRTLDRGLELFREEVGRILGARASSPHVSASSRNASVGADGVSASSRNAVPPGERYWKRRLPHYERPHGIYHVTFAKQDRKPLSQVGRTATLDAIRHFEGSRYRMLAACVMPDHVDLLFQPAVKEIAQDGGAIFWSLSELLHSLKSHSAKEINRLEGGKGVVWEPEYHDRLVHSDEELEKVFTYICRNPWEGGAAKADEDYPWLWTEMQEAVRQDAEPGGRDARAPIRSISGDFAFKLYDTYGFPLDLTQLMAREHGMAVDTDGFDRLMDQQRARARAAQKKEVIELSQIKIDTPTKFVGYDALANTSRVLDVVLVKDRAAVVLESSACYAEMGGQVGDQGELLAGGQLWRVVDTQKAGPVWLHFVEGTDAPVAGSEVELRVDAVRRNAIQRHHTVTHIFHWALHEVGSRDASQKGSFVGPEKLTFDFNSAPLTPAQVHDIERLVNERILENAPVSWAERPYAEVKQRKDVMQFFGDKYGEVVRVVQIGGRTGQLDGYSMELCGGTHTRSTGEIGLFRVVAEGAIAAGVRRVEAVAGMAAWQRVAEDLKTLKTAAGLANCGPAELEKRIEGILAHQKELEKKLKAAALKEAADQARGLAARARTINGIPAVIENVGEADGDSVAAMADQLRGQFKGVVVLGSAATGSVVLLATVSPDFTSRVQAGKIIQAIAPIVGGKGGGKPEMARGGGKDASKIDDALKRAAELLAGG